MNRNSRVITTKIHDLEKHMKYKVIGFKSIWYNSRTVCVIRLYNPMSKVISETFLPNRYDKTPTNYNIENLYFIYRGFIDSTLYKDKYHHIDWKGDYRNYIVYSPKGYIGWG